MARTGGLIGTAFTQKETGLRDSGLQMVMVSGIDTIKMGTEHSHWRTLHGKAAPMDCCINPIGQATKDWPARQTQGATQTVRHRSTMLRW